LTSRRRNSTQVVIFIYFHKIIPVSLYFCLSGLADILLTAYQDLFALRAVEKASGSKHQLANIVNCEAVRVAR
jgi:hypothetical protein